MNKVWKVFVSTYGENCDEHGWHTNGMEYPTKEEAEKEGYILKWNWTRVKEFKVREVEPGTMKDPDHKEMEK